MSGRPLPSLALGFAGGIALAEHLWGALAPVPPLPAWLVACTVGTLALAALATRGGKTRPAGALTATLSLVLAGAHLGALDLLIARRALGPPLEDAPSTSSRGASASTAAPGGAAIDLAGVVAEPTERAGGRTRVTVALADGRRMLWVDSPREDLQGDPARCPATEGAAGLLPGDQVRARASPVSPRGFVDPGAEDERRELGARGVFALAHLPGGCAGIARVAGAHGGYPFARVAARARYAAQRLLDARLGGGRSVALLEAMLLGDRGDLAPVDEQAFRDAGAAHLLCVSGLHLAALAWLLFVAFRAALLRWRLLAVRVDVGRIAALAAIPPLLAYVLVTGAATPTRRAAVVALAVLLGKGLARRVHGPSAIGAAALFLLVPSPLLLFDAAFDLSFAAILGISVLAARWTPEFLRSPSTARSRSGRAAGWILRRAARLLAISASALAGTAPVAATHFHQVAVGGLASSLLVAPIVELAVLPLGLAGILGAACTGAATPLLRVAGWAACRSADAVTAIGRLAPPFPFGAPTAGPIVAFALAALLLLWRPASARARRFARGGAALAVMLLVALIAAPSFARSRDRSLRITFLDVGQGDAAIVELPGHAVWIIDGGGSFDPTFDPGARAILPALTELGDRNIERVYLSHPHPDHMNGLVSVIAALRPEAFVDAGGDEADPAYARLLAALQAAGVPRQAPSSGTWHGVSVEVLAPRGDDGRIERDPTAGPNDNSVVLRLTYAGHSVLFAGDVEAPAEARLVAATSAGSDVAGKAGGSTGVDVGIGGLHADVLKVPHHGSRTSSTDRFLDAVTPGLAIISCGRGNRFGFPHAEVLARYRTRRVHVLRTDLDGAITVTIDPSGRIEASTLLDGRLP